MLTIDRRPPSRWSHVGFRGICTRRSCVVVGLGSDVGDLTQHPCLGWLSVQEQRRHKQEQVFGDRTRHCSGLRTDLGWSALSRLRQASPDFKNVPRRSSPFRVHPCTNHQRQRVMLSCESRRYEVRHDSSQVATTVLRALSFVVQ